jgi:hypothetical protein
MIGLLPEAAEIERLQQAPEWGACLFIVDNTR